MADHMLKVAIPDLVSNSYFPVVAAADLGCFAAEGLQVQVELVFPVDRAYRELRDGNVDFVAGAAHAALAAYPDWKGVKLLAAQAQGMYWFLVMRSDMACRRGDLSVLKGKRIGAAPWVEMGLRRLLAAAGLDVQAEAIEIIPVPGAKPVPGQIVNFGVTAARALKEGLIDGFWANGMGAEIAVQEGYGTIVLDVRRGDGPAEAFNYTMAALATSDALIATSPDVAAAAIRGLRRAQEMLREDHNRATKVGENRFPAREASLIAELVRRDLPYYKPSISAEFVSGMNNFCRDLGILSGDPEYGEVVSEEFADLRL
jgi:ABC-type nitrate/sulfonate/bicarbonate transport system substrate-binding protein